ncbi:hypothetical protein PGIGA_G00035640, partial [Pangasianodon gigas]|nr:hypothetical protein [Pangasianodon gigas]
LELNWSTPIAILIDWTYFEKSHTRFYKGPQFTLHCQDKKQAMKSKELSVDLPQSRWKSWCRCRGCSGSCTYPWNTKNQTGDSGAVKQQCYSCAAR